MPDERVIVIGSGPCGAIAALQLTRRGVPVTLLESGRRRPGGLLIRMAGNTILRRMPAGTIDGHDGYDATLDPDTEWWRDLTPGGLSNHWTAAVPRFAATDFGHGVDVDPVHRWPVTYDELAPFYDSVEEVIGVTGLGRSMSNLPGNRVRGRVELPSGWERLVGPAASFGHSVVPLPMAKGARWMAVRRGTEFNSWTEVVERLEGTDRFEVVLGAHVTRLNWAPDRSRVDSVDYLDRESGETVTMQARAVVVAAGDIHSTKLLLTSTSDDFPTGLGDVHGVLGRYLHDHPRDYWTFTTEQALTLPAQPVYMTRETPETSDPLLAAAWTIGLARASDRLKTYVRAKGREFSVQVFGTMLADPDHHVRLDAGSVNGLGQPKLKIHFGYDAATRQNMVDARMRLNDVLTTAGVGYRPIGVDSPSLTPGSSVHFAGSVRMHDDPRYGMLDRWNQLHAVPNVLVVDKSCFTTGPEKNPTLTAMALAARAADHLADELA